MNAGIAKKKVEEKSSLETEKLIGGNFEEWSMAEHRLNKIKRKLEKDKENLEVLKNAEE